MKILRREHIEFFWKYIKIHKKLLILSIIVVPFLSAMHLCQPYIVKMGIDNYIFSKELKGLYFLSIIFVFVVMMEFLLRSLQSYIFQYIGQRTVSRMRRDLFEHIQELPLSHFDDSSLGESSSSVISDMQALNESLSSGIVTLLSDLLIFIGILGMMFYLNVSLSLIFIVSIPLIFLVINFIRKRMKRLFFLIREKMSTINGLLQENLQGSLVIQLFEKEESFEGLLKDASVEYRHVVMRSVGYDSVLFSFIEMMMFVVIAIFLWFCFKGSFAGEGISLGVLVAFIDYTYKLFSPLKDFSGKWTVLQHALAALQRIFRAFEKEKEKNEGLVRLTELEGKVSFKNVSFCYNLKNTSSVLKNVSFDISPGQSVAIVGPSASGKTTIMRLILRLYSGYSGKIFLDNCDIQKIDIYSLRKNISVILQEQSLFPSSVAFNITLGKDSISTQKMQKCAKMVHVHDFIQSLPKGYDTVLDQNNVLSQGQSQLISMARVLAHSPKIVLMDEPMASLDSYHETIVQKGIREILKNKTTFVIAHRLSTVQQVDKILVVKHGQIVEEGNHLELMALGGFYRRLFNMQFKNM